MNSPTEHEPIADLPMVSVLMPMRNEAPFVTKSLGAVLAQDYPAGRMQVIVADGLSSDGTREIVQELSQEHSHLQLLDNPQKIVSTGLNAATAAACGEIIIRVDGHCEIASDYVRRCVEHIQYDGVDGAGGPINTVGQTMLARAIAFAMSCPFGVGGSSFRTIKNQTMLADTIPFPAYTRAIIRRAGPYDEELVRNQDDEYNYRLRKLGARLLLSAKVRSRYYSRSSLGAVGRQYFQYGLWKVRVMQKHPRQMQPRQFIPALFVAALFVSLVSAPFWSVGAWMLVIVVGSYLLANVSASVWTARHLKWRMTPLLVATFATLHFCYGLGFLMGLVRFWNRWRTQPVGKT